MSGYAHPEVLVDTCKIRSIPHSDSGVFRTVIPEHSAHFLEKMGREKNAG